MTELDLARRGGSLPVPLAQVTGGSVPGLQVLREWVGAARDAEGLVSPLVDTPFLPSSLWPLPPGVQPRDFPNPRMQHPRESVEQWQGRRQVACSSGTAAVLTGMTLGLDPLVALSQVFVVKGRPGLYAKIKVALAQRAGHDVWDEELTPERVTVCGRRKGWPEDRIVRITLTIEDAKRAEWTSNAAYAKTPIDMLWSRAVGRVLDRIAADTLNGIPSIETMDDEPEPLAQVTAEVVDTPARASAAAILARAAAPAPEPETVAAQVRTSEPAPVPEPDVHRYAMPVSKQKLDLIKAAFERHSLGATRGQAGAEQREKRMAVLSSLLDRPITDPRDLTADEGQMVIDNIGTDDGVRVIAEILNPELQAQRYAASDAEAEQVARAAAGLDEDDYAAAVQQQEDEAARAEAAAEQ